MKNRLTHLFSMTFGLLLFTVNLSSQTFRPPLVFDYIHANDIKAAVGQNSTNFWDFTEGQFLVPYKGPESPGSIFASALWISAEDQNGNTYASNEIFANNFHFLAGPLPVDETPLSEPEILNWNRIFKVSGTDILAHIQDASDGTIDRPLESIFGWPAAGNVHFESIHGFSPEYGAEGGAYFIEVPGSINGIYEPELGEYPHVGSLSPEVMPGEIAWAVYNNALHQEISNTSDMTMTVEIQQTSYSFDCPSEILFQNVFHDYKVISRTDDDLTRFRFGIWMDPDLGCATDDYLGCDPERNTFYSYNVDEEDGTVGGDCIYDISTYGENPPVQTTTFLNHEMDAFVIYQNGSADPALEPGTTDPLNKEEVIRYMNAQWRDGTNMTRGGDGYNPMSADKVRFLFPDKPNLPNGWSMYEEDLPPSDRRGIAVAASALTPGASTIFTLAFGYHNHPDSNHLSNVNFALDRVDILQMLYDKQQMGCLPELCTCECVWPGDANSDGRVNYLDAVNIIQALNDNGESRSDPYQFSPEEVADWNFNSFLNINSKYADTDGSGSVELMDLDLLSDYIGRSNYCVDDPIESCPEGEQVYFDIDDWGTDFPTRFGQGKIKVRSLDNFWGISFKIKYDPQLFSFVNALEAKKWKDESLEIIDFYHKKSERNEGELQLVFFNDAGVDAEPSNVLDVTIADFIIFPLELPEEYPDRYANLTICDFTVYYEDGTSEILPSMPARFRLPDSVTTAVPIFSEPVEPVRVYPNPGYGQYTIDTSYPVERVEIFNTQGQLIQTVQGNEIQIQGNKKGIYFFKIYSIDGGVGFSKVILQ